MDWNCKSTRLTPKKCSKNSENLNPNVKKSPFLSKSCKSLTKSAIKTQKSVSSNANTNQLASPSSKNKIRQWKFVIAKKKKKSHGDDVNASMVCNCNKDGAGKKKCLCVAYETLWASQEEFFKNHGGNDHDDNELEKLDRDDQEVTIPVSISEGEKLKEGLGSGGMSVVHMKKKKQRKKLPILLLHFLILNINFLFF
ncbi:putative microtubule-associated protein futsch-like [Capsicum annuum]|nr:putative microtubule-associated protein futsch-like [Capsicum annuum]KAF3615573.1 putative microtubule-associated protein futsch-like [Capsicum annuum]